MEYGQPRMLAIHQQATGVIICTDNMLPYGLKHVIG